MMMNTTLLKDNSISMFTHEIKNPLAVCNGYLDILQKEDIVNKDYLKIIKEEIKRTLDIINDYSLNNSISNLNYENFDLGILIEDVINTLNNLFLNNNSEIIFVNRRNLYLYGDYNKLKQVFINILKNSIEAKSSLKLLVYINVITIDNYYEIDIVDNGIGISREVFNNIFKDFFTTKKYGTGLGISFIKEIIKMHGGSVKYTSEENLGTKVIVLLPKEKSPKTFNNSNYY